MLSAIRGTLGSFVVLALLGLLIASFALWGIPDLFTAANSRAVASVDDVDITAIEFDRAFSQRLRQLESQVGQPIDRAQAAAFGIPQQVLQQMVAELTFDLHARSLGLRVSNSQVLDVLRGFEAFAGFDGKFDPQAYKNQLAVARITPKEFEEALKKDIVRRQLVSALAAATPSSEPLARALFRYRNEGRSATILSLQASDFKDVPAPTEDELKATYETDKGRYMTPEFRTVAVAEISPAAIARPDEISESEIEEAYAERAAEFQSPELRDIDVVTFGLNAEDDARRFIERAAAGEDFAALVEEMTDFTSDEIALGDQARTDLEQDYTAKIADTVFSTEGGSLSAPVQSVFGWHVFRVNAITAPVERALADVSDQLRDDLAKEKAYNAVYDISVKAEEALTRGAGLPEIAESLGLQFVSADVTRNGETRGGGDADPAIRTHIDAAWKLDLDEPVALEQAGEGGFVLIDVTAVHPPEQMPYEEVVDALRENMLSERRLAAAGSAAEAIAARLRAGETPADIARSGPAQLVVSNWVIRSEIERGEQVAPVVGRLMFDLDKGAVAVERNARGDGYVVLRLEDIRKGDPALAPAEYMALRARLDREALDDALLEYEAALRTDYGVDYNLQLVQEIVNPSGAL